MSRSITFERNEIVIKFSPLTTIAGLKHELKIPYSAVKGVEAGNFKLHWSALRVGGTSIPFGYKAGRFRYNGQKYFLSYHNPSKVVVLDLEDYDYDKVVVQVGQPKQIKQAILKRCPQLV
ncbi:PH domain-containing protein [Bacillus taeanensis]|nr:PH domain-containing protein [Bacillus taeanensis]